MKGASSLKLNFCRTASSSSMPATRTTTNLIGNALEIFVRFPGERRRLIENSGPDEERD